MTMRSCPVFICYRQVDGTKIAQWLYENLNGQHLPDIGHVETEEVSSLDVYFDQTAPAVSDWKAIHQPRLRTSQAMIIVCTPGAFQKLEKNDWVHREIDWWLKNRKVAPILIDATGEGERWVPKAIKDHWPDAQRIKVVQDDLLRLQGHELHSFEQQVRSRILNGIVLSKQRVVFEDLERQKKMSRLLSIAFAVALTLAGLAGWQWQRAERERLEADKQRERAKSETNRAKKAELEAKQQRERAESETKRAKKAEVEAKANRDEAIGKRNEALMAESRLLAKKSEVELNLGEWNTAGCLVLQALPHNLSNPDRPLVDEAVMMLKRCVEVARRFVLFRGHTKKVLSASLSPDGSRVVTTSEDGTARIWNRQSGREQVILKGHKKAPISAEFSADGERILTIAEGSDARLWNSETGALLSIIPGENETVYSAAFNSQGTKLIAATEGSINVYDANTGRVLKTINTGRHGEHRAIISRDGQRVVIGKVGHFSITWGDQSDTNESTDLELWSTNDDEGPVILSIPDSRESTDLRPPRDLLSGARGNGFRGIYLAAFSHDASLIAIAQGFTIHLWNAKTGGYIRNLKVAPYRDGSIQIGTSDSLTFNPDDMTFSPDDMMLLSSDSSNLRLWDVNTGQLLHNFLSVSKGEDITQASFSDDGDFITAVFGFEGIQYLNVWRREDGLQMARNILGRKGKTQILLATIKKDRRLQFITTRSDFTVFKGIATNGKGEYPKFSQSLIDEAKKLFVELP